MNHNQFLKRLPCMMVQKQSIITGSQKNLRGPFCKIQNILSWTLYLDFREIVCLAWMLLSKKFLCWYENSTYQNYQEIMCCKKYKTRRY